MFLFNYLFLQHKTKQSSLGILGFTNVCRFLSHIVIMGKKENCKMKHVHQLTVDVKELISD